MTVFGNIFIALKTYSQAQSLAFTTKFQFRPLPIHTPNHPIFIMGIQVSLSPIQFENIFKLSSQVPYQTN